MTNVNAGPSALTGYRVLELGDELGHYCGKLLADLGAEVIKVEPPEGAPTRRRGPFAGGVPNAEKSLTFLYFNENKLGVTLDLEQERDRTVFRDLVRSADAIVDSLPQGYLERLGVGYQALRQIKPNLVMASVTGFGQEGPHRDYKTNGLVTFAMSGLMAQTGVAPRSPLAPPRDATCHFVSIHVAAGVLGALYHRERTGIGQFLEVSAQEVMAQAGNVAMNYSSLRDIRTRGTVEEGGGTDAIATKDGYLTIGFFTMSRRNWQDFVAWVGNPQALQDPAWADRNYRGTHMAELKAIVEASVGARPKLEVYEDGQRHGLIMAPFNTPGAFLEDPHFNARGFVKPTEHPQVGKYRTIGPPFRLSATPCTTQRPAPLLGEHNTLLSTLAASAARTTPSASSVDAHAATPRRILDGIRVLDFTRAIAGPYMARILGEHGAQVIKVESSTQMQQRGTRPGQDPRLARAQMTSFAEANRNKMSITLDMRSEEGQRLARELARRSDVVVDNSSPRVLGHWGLDFETLRAVNPGIIVAMLPGYGTTGPHRDFLGAVNIFHYVAGLTYLWSYPGETRPIQFGTFLADYNGGIHGATAIMAALVHRQRTGQGQLIDVAQVEALASLLGPAYLEILVNGVNPQPQGNSRDDTAPHGCFRCRGEDAWCVVAVTSDEEWQALCGVLGNPSWCKDDRFATAAGRVAHREELESHLQDWTSGLTPYQVMGLLQEAGVPAGAVQNAEDMYRDPHLRARHVYSVVEHPGDLGALEHARPGVLFSETPARLEPYPLMGQDNQEVLCGLLGLSAQELERLVKDGIVA